MAPTWLGYGQRATNVHQSILAAWQPDPLWVSLIQIRAAAAFARLATRRDSNTVHRSIKEGDMEAHRWTLVSYLLAVFSSASGHVYVMYRVATSQNAETTLWRMYVPVNLIQVEGAQHILVEGPWLFLKYDFFIISLSSLCWAYYLCQHTLEVERKQGSSSRSILYLGMLLGSILIGPGSMVSLVLSWRERRLFAGKTEKVGGIK